MDKKGVGLLAFLFTWQGLLVIGAIIGLLFVTNIFPLAITQQISFAGMTWNVDQNLEGGGSNSAIMDENGFLVLSANAYSFGKSNVGVSTDITQKDEIIVMYEGNVKTIVTHGFSSSASFTIEPNLVSYSVGGSEGGTYEKTIPPTMVKIMNNFDGTHTIWRGLGIGDVFIREKTISTTVPTIITFYATATADKGESRATMRIYNIAVKSNEVPLCKLNYYYLDGQCQNLSSVMLSSEAAAKQSALEATIAAEARLNAKIQSQNSSIANLEQEIALMKEQLQSSYLDPQITTRQIEALNAQIALLNEKNALLKAEFDESKQVLTKIQERDPEVINIIDTGTKTELDLLLKERCNTSFCKFWRWLKSIFGQ